MNGASRQILRTYVTLVLLSTFAASFIWGINTLFLLDAGLSITGAFIANAFFTVGQVLFEVPTGVVADSMGRRISFLSGAATLFVATLLYLLLWRIGGPLWAWALVSVLLGLGFTFFSGATEAWLVDALTSAGYDGTLDDAFAKGEIASGFAMLTGSVAGGVVAQFTNLGVPYLLRAAMLGMTFLVAWVLMRDLGFAPRKSASVMRDIRRIAVASVDYGLRNPPVRWVMLAGPFLAGVGYFVFYAMQPFLLELYGSEGAYAIAGLAAAIIACAQIIGGFVVPYVRRVFRRRTMLLAGAVLVTAGALALIGLFPNFWLALILLALWAVVDSVSFAVRQAFINGLIPSSQRATVLSSDNLLSAAGGVVQPLLGRAADVWGYAASYVVGAGIALVALPFTWLARREDAPSDRL
ncbi:MAG: MFS transporter [Thiohalomonadaceae bacterium]